MCVTLTAMKFSPDSVATARAVRVLEQPGGPKSSTPAEQGDRLDRVASVCIGMASEMASEMALEWY